MDKWKNIRNFQFSKVEDFDSNDFVFLVHAIDLPNSCLREYHLVSLLSYYGGNYNLSQKIDLALNPEKIVDKEFISCSLVAKQSEKELFETYKSFGFILKCPVENIMAASFQDLGILYTFPGDVRQKYKDEIIMSFNDMICQSFGDYNEVLIEGSTTYGKVEIDGIFVNLGHFSMSDESFMNKVIAEAKQLENKLGVPLIYFPRKKYIIEDRPVEIVYDAWPGEKAFLKEISFAKNGKKFRLYVGHSNSPVLQSIIDGFVKPMSEEDFIVFMKEIKKLSSEELKKHADLIDSLPQIFLDNYQIMDNELNVFDKNKHT